MNKEEAKKLFDRYVKNQCSPREIELLRNYLDSFQDRDALWSELDYDGEIKDRLWSKIGNALGIEEMQVESARTKASPIPKFLRYAAVVIVLTVGLIWYQSKNHKNIEFEAEQISVADDAIILRTSENSFTKIDTEGEQTVVDTNGKIIGRQNGNQISYKADAHTEELVYNEIVVPAGKKFKLALSDGSSVHMNSGSSLKYPVYFIQGADRKVFLKGEAYFEVAKDVDSPFLVTTDEMEIKVLGTHFNVSSYQGSDTFAVLAEGSVAVYDKKYLDAGPKTIRPGEKAVVADNAIEVTAVDLDHYLGWREGLLAFNNETFVNIIEKIERHYAVSIENDYPALDSVRFRGFFKDETITDLMDTFEESAGFEYIVDNKKIVIEPMKD